MNRIGFLLIVTILSVFVTNESLATGVPAGSKCGDPIPEALDDCAGGCLQGYGCLTTGWLYYERRFCQQSDNSSHQCAIVQYHNCGRRWECYTVWSYSSILSKLIGIPYAQFHALHVSPLWD